MCAATAITAFYKSTEKTKKTLKLPRDIIFTPF